MFGFQSESALYQFGITAFMLQFFDADSLLPPPFTFLSLLMYLIKNIEKKTFSKKGALQRSSTRKFRSMAAKDIEYRSLIFSFIDNVKPQPDVHKGKFGKLYHIILFLIPVETVAQMLLNFI